MKRLFSLVLVMCMLCAPSVQAEQLDELEAMLEKGIQFVDQGDYDSAVICFDIAEKLSENDPRVLDAISYMYMAKEEYDQAYEYIEDALELAPADGELYLKKARILLLEDEMEEALLAMRYAEICGQEADDELRIMAAVALYENGYYSECVSMFESADEELWWFDHAALFGQALVKSGNRARAQELGLQVNGAKDETIARAMAQGKAIRMTEKQTDFSEYPVFCSVAYYEQYQNAEEEGVLGEYTADGRVKLVEKLSDLADVSLQVISVSPSGEMGLYNTAGGAPVLVKNGEITIVTPNMSRMDTETFAMINRLDQDSVVWSPDGRYIALTYYGMTTMGRYMDLMVVDTVNGELKAAESTPTQMTKGDALAAVGACFSPAGESIYYLVIGKVGENARMGLKRYDIATGEVSLLCTVEEMLYCKPTLYWDVDGPLCMVADSMQEGQSAVTIVFAQLAGEWIYRLESFDESTVIRSPVHRLYSENSYAKMTLNLSPEFMGRYMTLEMESPMSEQTEYAVMLPLEGTEAVVAPLAELFVPEEVPLTDRERMERYPYYAIQEAALSPDGYYALILASGAPGIKLFILEFDSMRFTELVLPEGVDLRPMNVSVTGLTLEWNMQDCILIPTTAGTRAFDIEPEE